ncbi:HNH endonuclease signature motif containing protein [Prauserella halophila]|uniref:HNH endonuclease signature motif containing protein n=1 Tax=Prauserella halophila TaxID=185641 RepID=A0ABN1WKK1_9PSEU|nr:HNH endonuclease signature motif containing protein [Prauserella halophila]MCP2237582.1 protein of unknown function (DUF222) [Prauserella halophila]
MEITDVVHAWRQIGRAQAAYLRALAEFSAEHEHTTDVTAELALARGESEHVVRRELEWAHQLTSCLPHTLNTLASGDIDLLKASKVAYQTKHLSSTDATRVDQLVTEKLRDRSADSIRRTAYDAVHRVDPGGAAARARQRRTERKVELRHHEDAMATVSAYLPAERAAAVYAHVDRDARATRRPDDQRTTDQLRADVLADQLLAGCSCGIRGDADDAPPPVRNPRRTTSDKAQIYIHIDFETLTTIRNNPAHLSGHGPIPAEVAREIASDPKSTWRRIITDPRTGAPLDVGRERYRPPAVTAEYVKVRDRECRFPGCHRPTEFSDLDHVRPHGCNGPTCAANLIGLCRRHHIVKHTPDWVFELESDGTLRITTPEGTIRTGKPAHLDTPPNGGKTTDRKRRRRRGNRRSRNRNRNGHRTAGNRTGSGQGDAHGTSTVTSPP